MKTLIVLLLATLNFAAFNAQASETKGMGNLDETAAILPGFYPGDRNVVVTGKKEEGLTKIGGNRFPKPCFPLENCAIEIVKRAYPTDRNLNSINALKATIVYNMYDDYLNWVTAAVHDSWSRVYIVVFQTHRAAGPYGPMKKGFEIEKYQVVENEAVH